ncbi:hypothetical protein NEMBOFW57_003275 [Staphylotrichum longicolle]|uniref:Uncharacterized protein n=1 Tax=Staphylotrichum longicolle TaxID=669026 RepID=A0AAD4F5P2_9PEZI|nr:hypothetical protein NEMBOFW57_003275 [Staphylotrichum longicolle]
MDTDRQDQVGSPLIEDFLDCDQLASDSDVDSSGSASPRRGLKRLHIHADMTCTQYLTPGPHHSERPQIDGLPLCSNVSQSGVYSSPDLDTYSAVSGVSSFNYPAAADPSLLTPASSAGSPPLQHRQSSVKPTRNYHAAQSSAPCSQPPTPPDSSRMYGYNGFDVNSNNQGDSPMTVNPAVTEAGSFDMNSYMAHSPPISHHPSSPKSDLPPPIDPYLGHFTVSSTNDGEQHRFSLSHTVTIQAHSTPKSAPLRICEIRALSGALLPHGALSPGKRAPPRKKAPPSRKASRPPKPSARLGSDSNSHLKQEDNEELVLADDAPADDKYLFQLRKEFISEKGKGMWEEMKAKYSEKHQGNWEKAALQMKVSRAVARYGVWPENEVERLKEAFRHFEDLRYQYIIARMKENGGCRVWDWKPGHIVSQLCKMGWETPDPDEKNGTRRRRQKLARRQASPQNGGHAAAAAAAAATMGDWSNGLGLHHPAFHGHAQHVAAGPNLVPEGYPGAPSHMTPAQHDELVNQVFKTERDLTPDEGMEGLSYDGGSGSGNHGGGSRRPSTVASSSHELNHQVSARVALQACDQMLQTPRSQGGAAEHAYGTR